MPAIVNTYMQPVEEMKRQIGPRAFYMLGASNLGGSQTVDGDPVLSFRVGRNDKGVTHVRVILAPDDTYRVESLAVRGMKVRVVAEIGDVYCDQLHAVLESHTGMRTSL